MNYILFFICSVVKSDQNLLDACRSNNVETVQKLVAKKIDVNSRNQVGHFIIFKIFKIFNFNPNWIL